jgi:hypothetical protein
MTEKMEQIENKIKGTVDETTHSVKRMVDVRHQAGEHPWAALSISVLVGYWLGSMGNGSSESGRHGDSGFRNYSSSAPDAYAQARYASNAHEGASSYSSYNPSASYGSSYNPSSSYGSSSSSYNPSSSYGSSSSSYNPSGSYGSSYSPSAGYSPSSGYSAGSGSSGSWQQESRHASKPGMLDSVTSQFGDEIEALKSAAVTSLVGLLRDTIRQNFPTMHQEMERVRGEQGYSSGGGRYSGFSAGGSQYGSGSQYASSDYNTSGSQHGGSQYGSGSTAGSSSQTGASGADYARSAANNPSHLGGTAGEPSRTPPERDSDSTARNQ